MRHPICRRCLWHDAGTDGLLCDVCASPSPTELPIEGAGNGAASSGKIRDVLGAVCVSIMIFAALIALP